MRLMASPHGVDPVNLGNPRETTVLELAEMIKRLARSKSEIVRAPLPKDDPTRRKPDITRAQELLGGWGPRVSLEEGLAATIDDFRDAPRRSEARVRARGVEPRRARDAAPRSARIERLAGHGMDEAGRRRRRRAGCARTGARAGAGAGRSASAGRR